MCWNSTSGITGSRRSRYGSALGSPPRRYARALARTTCRNACCTASSHPGRRPDATSLRLRISGSLSFRPQSPGRQDRSSSRSARSSSNDARSSMRGGCEKRATAGTNELFFSASMRRTHATSRSPEKSARAAEKIATSNGIAGSALTTASPRSMRARSSEVRPTCGSKNSNGSKTAGACASAMPADSTIGSNHADFGVGPLLVVASDYSSPLRAR